MTGSRVKKTVTYILILIFITLFYHSFAQQKRKLDSIFKRDHNLPALTINFNPVGLLLYGPIIQMEFKVAHHSYLTPWLRYNYAGLTSQYLWTDFEEDDDYYFPSSISVAAGFKRFELLRLKERLMYYGFFVELIHEKGLHNMESYNEYEQTHMAVAVYGNIGYRMKFNGNFYINLGILPGFSFDIKNEGLYTNSEEPLNISKKNRIVGNVDLAFGWKLGR
jgi:hypothetical protein